MMFRTPSSRTLAVHRKLAAPAAVIFAAALTAVSAQGVAACAQDFLPWTINAVVPLAGQNARIFIAQTDVHRIHRENRGAETVKVAVCKIEPLSLASAVFATLGFVFSIPASNHQHAAP